MAWSEAAVRDLWGQSGGAQLAHLLTITSPDLAEPLRITSWDEAITSDGETFERFPFQFAPPSADSVLAGEATLEIAVVDSRIAAALNAVETPVMSIDLVRANDPDAREPMLSAAKVASAGADHVRASVTLRARPFADEPANQARYTPSRVRGLF